MNLGENFVYPKNLNKTFNDSKLNGNLKGVQIEPNEKPLKY